MKIGSLNNIHFSSQIPPVFSNFNALTSNNVPVDNNLGKAKISNRAKVGIVALGAAFLGALTLVLFAKKGKNIQELTDEKYIGNLAKNLSVAMGQSVAPEQLSCVMGKNELQAILPKFEFENYNPTSENMLNGILKADLHSHTLHSDGWGKVENILNDAVNYGNQLNKTTGEKFIFALTDHDGLDGVKEALKLIARNPEKYENIRFVAGVELSFIHKLEKDSLKALRGCNKEVEGSELLMHCIDPFSKNLNEFIDNVRKNRGDMVLNTLEELSSNIKGVKFLREEMDEFYLKKPDENFIYNMHLRVLNYAQVKNRVNQLALERGENPEVLYKSLMENFKIGKNEKSLDNFEKYLEKRSIKPNTPLKTDAIDEICRKYFPKIENGKITAPTEHTFEEIINAASKEQGVFLGFAHPVFLAQNFKNPSVDIGNYIKNSKGLIQATEKFHQGYVGPIKRGDITQNDVDEVNLIIDKFELLNVGGVDNHSWKLFN